MFESIQYRKNTKSETTIDIAPLIDMVFILLLFFLVTTTFVKESGIIVQRPQAQNSQKLAPESMRILIAASGAIYIQGKSVDLEKCRNEVSIFVSRNPKGLVIIIPDEKLAVKRLICVMDAAKQGNAKEIAVATQKKERWP